MIVNIPRCNCLSFGLHIIVRQIVKKLCKLSKLYVKYQFTAVFRKVRPYCVLTKSIGEIFSMQEIYEKFSISVVHSHVLFLRNKSLHNGKQIFTSF